MQKVDRLYGEALNKFRGSAQLHVFIALYIQHYRPNHHLELLHLSAAEVMSSSVSHGAATAALQGVNKYAHRHREAASIPLPILDRNVNPPN